MNNNAIGYAGKNIPNLTVLRPTGAERREEEQPRMPSPAKSEGARKIEQSIQYMVQHLNEPLHVAQLAETAHTSPSHFFVLFKRWAGLSPIDYFIRLRMRQACRLLAATSMSVKEVAAVLGYDDPFYFSRVFKSVNGTPPTDYRLNGGQRHSESHGGDSGAESHDPLSQWPIAGAVKKGSRNERSLPKMPGILHYNRRVLLFR